MSRYLTNKAISATLIFIGFMLFLGSCSVQNVRRTPTPALYTKIDSNFYANGFPKQHMPWVVYSDRSRNKINPTKKDNLHAIYKETAFLTPFIVLQKNNGMLKLAEYKADLINDGKAAKKAVKVVGWLPEDRLLLWSNSLKNSKTGFASKAALVVNHQDVIKGAEKFIENDSAFVFTGPDLLNKTGEKIRLGSLVYIYKQSEDKKRLLIGKQQSAIPDSIQHTIYGWINSQMLSIWGERSALKVNGGSLGIKLQAHEADTGLRQNAIESKELNQRTGLAGIYPNASSVKFANQIKYFTNVFDYDKNKIYNVLGHPIYYRKYKDILSENRKLNVIFVLDVSNNNRLYIPAAKSLLQEMQLNLVNSPYFTDIKFGGVVYKQNSCGVSPLHSSLSRNYRDIALFFEDRIAQLTCRDLDIVQPVDRGLLAATNMLAGAEDETNLIVLIGTTADQNMQSQRAINALTQANAKLIFFQTQSKSADAYNDFVLLGQKLVVSSSINIAERKKEKIVNQNDLLIDNNYSLTTGETGVYSLDYPKQSMTQGFVIFPKKGESMQVGVLKSAIDTLLVQVTHDNKQIDSTLTTYFRSEIGVNNTKVADAYTALFPLPEPYIPSAIASSLLNQNTSFLIDAVFTGDADSIAANLKPGILVNELEYDQLQAFYTQAYTTVFSHLKRGKREGLSTYIKFVSKNTPSLIKIKRRQLKKMPMGELLRITTGFTTNGNSSMDMTAKEWIKSRDIKLDSVLRYVEQFKEIAELMRVSKGDAAIRMEHEGQVFYWLNEAFIPKMTAVFRDNKSK